MGLLDMRFKDATGATAYGEARKKLNEATNAWNAEAAKLRENEANKAKTDEQLGAITGKAATAAAGASDSVTTQSLYTKVATAKAELETAEKEGGLSLFAMGAVAGIAFALIGTIIGYFVPVLRLIAPIACALVGALGGAGVQWYRFRFVPPAQEVSGSSASPGGGSAVDLAFAHARV
jgi:hypothetical protein